MPTQTAPTLVTKTNITSWGLYWSPSGGDGSKRYGTSCPLKKMSQYIATHKWNQNRTLKAVQKNASAWRTGLGAKSPGLVPALASSGRVGYRRSTMYMRYTASASAKTLASTIKTIIHVQKLPGSIEYSDLKDTDVSWPADNLAVVFSAYAIWRTGT